MLEARHFMLEHGILPPCLKARGDVFLVTNVAESFPLLLTACRSLKRYFSNVGKMCLDFPRPFPAAISSL